MADLLACRLVMLAALPSSWTVSLPVEGLRMGAFRRLHEMQERLGSIHCCLQSSLVSRSPGWPVERARP
jgi:hypothetical protein